MEDLVHCREVVSLSEVAYAQLNQAIRVEQFVHSYHQRLQCTVYVAIDTDTNLTHLLALDFII